MIRWPLREALRGYRKRVHAMELRDYQLSLLIYAIQSPWMKRHERPPKPPAFLREARRGHP